MPGGRLHQGWPELGQPSSAWVAETESTKFCRVGGAQLSAGGRFSAQAHKCMRSRLIRPSHATLCGKTVPLTTWRALPSRTHADSLGVMCATSCQTRLRAPHVYLRPSFCNEFAMLHFVGQVKMGAWLADSCRIGRPAEARRKDMEIIGVIVAGILTEVASCYNSDGRARLPSGLPPVNIRPV